MRGRALPEEERGASEELHGGAELQPEKTLRKTLVKEGTRDNRTVSRCDCSLNFTSCRVEMWQTPEINAN